MRRPKLAPRWAYAFYFLPLVDPCPHQEMNADIEAENNSGQEIDRGKGKKLESKKEERKEEIRQPKKSKILESSYPLFVLLQDLVQTEHDIKGLVTGYSSNPEKPDEKSSLELHIGISLRVSGTKKSAETLMDSLKKMQNTGEGILDMTFNTLMIKSEDLDNYAKLAEKVVEICHQHHRDSNLFEEWRQGVEEVPLSAEKKQYECREFEEEGWDAFPLDREKKDGEEIETEANSRPNVDSENHNLDLYNSRLARIPENCISVPIILRCLIEQVAANCIDTNDQKAMKKSDEAREEGKMDALYSYFDSAIEDLERRSSQTGFEDRDASQEGTVVFEGTDFLTCAAAKALLFQKSDARRSEHLITLDKCRGVPVHAMSSEERTALKRGWPLKIIGGRAFPPPDKCLSDTERGLLRSQLLSKAEGSKNYRVDELERAVQCKIFGQLTRVIENAWKQADPYEVGKKIQDWKPASRCFAEELSQEAMFQVLMEASNSMCGATKTAWRYCAADDTVLAVCHAHTPMLRKRHLERKICFHPRGLKRSYYPPNIHKIASKPRFMYDLPPELASVELKEILYFPTDQGKLGMQEITTANGTTRNLFLEKDANLATITNSPKGAPELFYRFRDGSSVLCEQSGDVGSLPSFITSTPDGLRTELCGSQNCIYQSKVYTKRTETDGTIVNENEDLCPDMESEEEWRCVLDSGAVIVRYRCGKTLALLPDGRVLRRKKEGSADVWQCTEIDGSIFFIYAEGNKSEEEFNENETKEVKAGLDTQQSQNDAQTSTRLETVTQFDSQSGATVTTREDLVMRIQYENGSTLIQHRDGTRIFSEFVVESGKRLRFIIEHPGYATVKILQLKPLKKNLGALLSVMENVTHDLQKQGLNLGEMKRETKKATEVKGKHREERHAMTIEIPGLGTVHRMEKGSVSFRKLSGERLVVDPQGKCVFIPIGKSNMPLTRELRAGIVSKAHIPLESYLLDISSGGISVVDREENFFKVSMKEEPNILLSRELGPGASSLEAKEETNVNSRENDTKKTQTFNIPAQYYPPPNNASPPRYFCIRRDGSGFELHSEQKVQAMLRILTHQKNAFVELPHEISQSLTTDSKGAPRTADKRQPGGGGNQEDEEDIEIEDNLPLQKEENGSISDIKIIQSLEPHSNYTFSPPIPTVVSAGACQIEATHIKKSEQNKFPPPPPKNAKTNQIQVERLEFEESQVSIYTFRVIKKLKTIQDEAMNVAEQNFEAVKALERKLRRKLINPRKVSSVLTEAAVSQENKESVRIQMAILAARRRNYGKSLGNEKDLGKKSSAQKKADDRAKYMKNPDSVPPREFFEATANQTLQKLGSKKFNVGNSKKISRQGFSNFFHNPENKKFFKLHKFLRSIFTKKCLPKKHVNINGKPRPDEDVYLHWLPEQKLRANFEVMNSLVKYLSRTISHPDDPTLKTVNLFIPPYADVLRSSPTIQEKAPKLLNFLGYESDGEVMILAGRPMKMQRVLEEIVFFLRRIEAYLAAREDERKVDQSYRQKEEVAKKKVSSRASSAKVDIQENMNATLSEFEVITDDGAVINTSTFGSVQTKQPSASQRSRRKNHDSARLNLKHRPVHYTVSNERRMRSLEKQPVPSSVGTRSEYSEQEAQARKRLQTSSTYHINKISGADGCFTEFVLRPNRIDFGDIPPASLVGCTMTLKNEGNRTGRYSVTQPRLMRGQQNLLRIVHKVGPVAAGMTVTLEVQIWSGAVGTYSDEIHIATETAEHLISVSANIDPDAPRVSRVRSNAPGHIRLVSRRVPPAFKRILGAGLADSKHTQQEHKVTERDSIPEPNLPNFESTFNQEFKVISPQSDMGLVKEETSKDSREIRTNEDSAGPIPDADEATATKSNQALESKMLASMKNM